MENVGHVECPTVQYNEDVKERARKNNLKIIDARFQGDNKQCDKPPKLTKIKGSEEKEPVISEEG